MEVRCPHCHAPIDLPSDTSLSAITCPSCGSSFGLLGEDETASFKGSENKTIGHFELIEQIGIGSFGCVWRAQDTELDRTVAVKIPRKGQLDAAETEQFLREARAAAQLRHPNIVSVHEVGRDADSVFIVSDYIEGVTLSEWLTGKKLTACEAAELCAKIADALHHAHEAGVVHRDLKPGNIMVDANGAPHIMDFGLARREAGEVTMTVEGRVLGTPAYMSPEQAKGESHQADRRSDVYSLGVILFELLTGERPFRGNARMLVHQVIHDEPPSPRRLNGGIPRDLETICLKCLQKERAQRYETGMYLAEDLHCYVAGKPIQARPVTRLRRGWRWCRRNPLAATFLMTVVIFVVAITCVSLLARHTAIVSEQTAWRRSYNSDMYSAGVAWQRNNTERVRELLSPYDDGSGHEDLRGWEWRYLRHEWNENRGLLETDIAIDSLRVAVSADGRRIVVASPFGESGALYAISEANGQAFNQIDSFGTEVMDRWSQDNYAAISGDGEVVAFPAPQFANVLVRNSHSGTRTTKPLPRNEAPDVTYPAAALSNKSHLLAVSTSDGRVQLWDADALVLDSVFPRQEGAVVTLAFSPDDRLLVAGLSDGRVFLGDMESKRWRPLGAEHDDRVWDAAFSANGSQFATCSSDGTVLVWTCESHKLIARLGPFRDEARAICFSPVQPILAVGSRDSAIRLYDTNEFRELARIRGYGARKALRFLSDGRLIFVNSKGELAICRVPHRVREVHLNGGNVVHTCLIPYKGTLVLAACSESSANKILRWKIDEGDRVSDLPLLELPFPVGCMACAVDGHWAVGDAKGSDIFVYNNPIDLEHHDTLEPGNATVQALRTAAFSSSGARLAVGSRDGQIAVWSRGTEPSDWTPDATWLAHQGGCCTLAFNPQDENMIVSGGLHRQIRFWIVGKNSTSPQGAPYSFRAWPTSVAFSPSGDMVACALFASTVAVWEWPSSRSVRMPRSGLYSAAVSFLSDRRTMVLASTDRELRLWDIPTQQERFRIETGSSILSTLAISPDETVIAAGDRAGTIHIWQAPYLRRPTR